MTQLDTGPIVEIPGKLSARLTIELGRHIMSTPAPGGIAPSESQIVATYSVSRTVAREALQALSLYGMIDVSHGRRPRVRPRTDWDFFRPEVLAMQPDTQSIVDIITELNDVRMLIEPEIAARAAARADTHSLEVMSGLVAKMSGLHGDIDAYAAVDTAFHLELAKSSNNRVLQRFMDLSDGLQQASRHLTSVIPQGLTEATAAHRKILDAVRARDGERARDEMIEHIRWNARAWT
jgi:DNA-binding FadR family transcriptional regulator